MPGLLYDGVSVCGIMNVQDANEVVPGYSPTTRSTDNELRVIGNESLKMNSDYLRGAIPLSSLPP